jgi:PhnB protein
MAVNPIPAGYPTVIPYLIVQHAAEALAFYQQTFGATERMRIPGPNGTVGHAEIALGDSVIMLADEFPEMGFRSPQAFGGAAVSLHLYVEDVDARFQQATAAGAKVLKPVQDQFYGDRSGVLEDPFGHVWNLATHIEDVAPEEMQRRIAALTQQEGV